MSLQSMAASQWVLVYSIKITILLVCDYYISNGYKNHKTRKVQLIYRFIGPFLSVVQTWDRRLALISEVIEEWMATQRKWLYLEGIFVGGDIRVQLPDEAKKFDDIDKSFRKVSSNNGTMNTDIERWVIN